MPLHPHRLDHAQRRQRVDEHDAPIGRVGAVGKGQAQHRRARTGTRRSVAPPMIPTVRPTSACASSDAPAATTTPAPSLPTGID